MLDSFFLMAVFYGNHALHHLFPTLDHSVLPLLTHVFLETCEEFGVAYQKDSVIVTAKGAIKETARIIPPDTLAVSVKQYKSRWHSLKLFYSNNCGMTGVFVYFLIGASKTYSVKKLNDSLLLINSTDRISTNNECTFISELCMYEHFFKML